MTKQFAVLGQPIGHSLSPAIHTSAYRVLELDWRYQKFEVASGQLGEFLAQHPEFDGFSVTMPLKKQAAQLAQSQCVITAATGIANTLLRLPEGGYAAHNTDVPALAKIFKAHFEPQQVVVLGAGATAISAALAAALVGANEICFVARREQAAQQAAAALQQALQNLGNRTAATPALTWHSFAALTPPQESPSAQQRPQANTAGCPGHAASALAWLDDVDFVVNTLPGDAVVNLPEQLSRSNLYDVSYSPWPTATAARWLAAPERPEVLNGLVMLQQQALLQLRLFVSGDIRAALPNEAAVWQAITTVGVTAPSRG